MKIRIQCPAKVNLFLEITGKRPDGYHRLSTLFAKINLYDVLELEERGPKGVALELDCDDPSVTAGPDNLVTRAAEAFIKEFRVGMGVKIKLVKRIPVGAGLGGGSSDAAGTLLGLAKLFDFKLDARRRLRLHRIGVKLGADVPFFLQPAGFCHGTGIGDRLKPVKSGASLPYMVLVYPGVHISTVSSYKALPPREKGDVLTRLAQLDKLFSALKTGRPVEEWASLLFNRLEQAQLPAMAQVEQARAILSRMGLSGVRMSGSGSSVFGFARSHSEAEACVARLKAYPWKIFLTSCF